jgi:hypothetical protein
MNADQHRYPLIGSPAERELGIQPEAGVTNCDQAHFSALLFLFLLLLQLPAFGEEVILTRAFSMKFRKVEDAVFLVNRLLSDKGAVTMQPHLKTIIVQDYESNLKEIGVALDAFDTPPPSVELSIKLILARKSESAVPSAQEMKDIGKLGEVLRFNHYTLLDDGTITSEEGRSAAINLAKEYQVTFLTDVIQEGNGIIRLKNFELRKIKKGKGGKDSSAPLLSVTLNLRNSETLVLGASRFEESDRALLIILLGKVKQ